MAILLDAHVHYHPAFAAQTLLEAAWHNFRLAGGLSSTDFQACLCLTEAAGERAFERLSGSTRSQPGAWQIRPAGDQRSLVARRQDGAELLLVTGRQIVAREGLEVLALGCDPALPDGQAIREVIAETRAAGALPVLPWGFGKWTLRRGRLVAALLDEARSPDLFLGDNGGRAAALPSPLFAAAMARGIWVIPGSDPLPFAPQQERVGSYGCILPGALDMTQPSGSLLERLRALREQPQTFGQLQPLGAFVTAQLRMQWRKRRRNVGGAGRHDRA